MPAPTSQVRRATVDERTALRPARAVEPPRTPPDDDTCPAVAEQAGSRDRAGSGPVNGAVATLPRVAARQSPHPVPTVPDEAESAATSRDERTRELTRALRATTDAAARQQLIESVVLLNLPIARSIALRYRDRGEPLDDLRQVAYLGLLKAVHGYDPDRGHDFLSFAVPTISGEVKRHFRDRGWDIRPPRRVQDLKPQVERAADDLNHTLQRSPTVREIADKVGATQEQVIETLVAARSYTASSLDTPVADDAVPLADRLGALDEALEGVVDYLSVRPLIAALPERERTILALRFGDGLTQSQIAERIGVSQMQVSRLLARTLSRLRSQLEDS